MSSTLPGIAAAKPSKLHPHSLILSGAVAPGWTWSIVFSAVPVAILTKAPVVCCGPFGIKYCMTFPLVGRRGLDRLADDDGLGDWLCSWSWSRSWSAGRRRPEDE